MRQIGKHGMAFIAAGLFYLAGLLWIATGLLSHRGDTARLASIGAMFLCIGFLWTGIGMKYKREAQ
jgi:hypothetical protein